MRILPATDTPKRTASRRQNLSDESRGQTSEAARQAQEQIAENQRELTETKREIQENMDLLNEQYAHQSQEQTQRQEESLNNQRLRGYEDLRNIKQNQEKELARIKREGERMIDEASEYYRSQNSQIRSRGDDELKELLVGQQKITEFQKSRQEAAQTSSQQQAFEQLSAMKTQQDSRLAELKENSEKQIEQTQGDFASANEQAHASYLNRYKNAIESSHNSLAQMQSKAARTYNDLTMDTARKLAAYGQRQEDPFYQLVDFSAEIHETPDEFILTARIPPHERDNIQVNFRGNEMVLTGSRRSDGTYQGDTGELKTTSSYQTFTQTFPLNMAVQSRSLVKEFDGDTLIARVYKEGARVAAREPHHQPRPARVRADRPVFPSNLPLEKPEKN